MSFRNPTLALTLAVAGACFAGSVVHASVFEGEQCSAHIMTSHPGIDVTVPDGGSLGATTLHHRLSGPTRSQCGRACPMLGALSTQYRPFLLFCVDVGGV